MIQRGITIGASLAIVILVFMIARKLGLGGPKRTESDKIFEDRMADEMNAMRWIETTSVFDPSFWKDKSFRGLSNEQLTSLAMYLDDSFNPWWTGGDDESTIYAVFEQMDNIEQVSQLSDQFRNMYKTSLRGKIIDHLDSTEINRIKNIIEGY